MRTLTALAAFIPAMMFAQSHTGPARAGSQPIGVPQVGALGGPYAGQGSSRPLGGIAPPTYGSAGNGRTTTVRNNGSRYYGPVYYVPNAYSTFSEETVEPVNTAPIRAAGVQFSGAAPVAQPQTVIVNQYYGKDDAPLNSGRVSAANTAAANSAVSQDYYLIAYKNHHVITALAYWLDNETLHYVTAANAHNQSSLSLIDLDLTKRLNADHEVPFAAAAK